MSDSAAQRSNVAWGRGLQQSEHRALLTAGDLAVAAAAVVLAIGFWTITAGVGFVEALTSRAWWFLAAPIWAFGLAPARRPRVALSPAATLQSVARLAAALLVAYLAVYFYAPRQALPRLLALYFAWEACLLTVAWRLTYVWVFTETRFRRRLLVAGAGAAGRAIVAALQDGRVRDATIVGFVDADFSRTGSRVDGLEVVGGFDVLPGAAKRAGVSQIIVATECQTGEVMNRLLACQEAGIDVVPMAAVYEQTLKRVPVAHVEPNWLFTSYAEAVSARDASRLAKRLFDIVGGLAGLVVFAIGAPIIAMAILADSGRPVFYMQRRTGRGGRPFPLAKFRTMVRDAEAEGRPQWTGPADARITRVGKWLRRTRLDELPNFLSVLRGDMSLVGPRPERPEFVTALERQVPLYRARLFVRPGLTGWAQINYRYGDSVADAAAKLEFDLYYLKHRSFLFDAWILLRTVGTVMSLGGR
jgi:exopolysaccharide biosynthesis polyprenyl glycosylphosphotransferase